jgi:hypothetical protein
LVVVGRSEAKLNRRSRFEEGVGQEVAAIQLRAIRSKRVDLARGVDPLEKARAVTTSGVAPDDDDIAMPRCPLAFDAPEAFSDLEDQVAASTLCNWSVDVDAQPHGREGDG